jgi:hypothetical protein
MRKRNDIIIIIIIIITNVSIIVLFANALCVTAVSERINAKNYLRNTTGNFRKKNKKQHFLKKIKKTARKLKSKSTTIVERCIVIGALYYF